MAEIWRQVDSFENYEVSNHGSIRNRKTARVLRQHNRNGYKSVVLYSEGRWSRLSVHRLVAVAFIPNSNNLPQVNHIDGDKTNNHAENLEWCTGFENQQHRVNVLLKAGFRSVMCVETGDIYNSIVSAAKQNNSYIPNIVRACKNGTTAVGYHWRYL